jgi:hydroxyacylglutathione hydrolase
MTNVISLKLSMSNAFLLRGEKDILVDSGSPADFPILTRQLDKYGVEVNGLALIVLTHVHFDHAGTVAALVKQAKCPVAVHRLEKENLELGQNAPIIPVHPLGKMLIPFMGAGFAPLPLIFLWMTPWIYHHTAWRRRLFLPPVIPPDRFRS